MTIFYIIYFIGYGILFGILFFGYEKLVVQSTRKDFPHMNEALRDFIFALIVAFWPLFILFMARPFITGYMLARDKKRKEG